MINVIQHEKLGNISNWTSKMITPHSCSVKTNFPNENICSSQSLSVPNNLDKNKNVKIDFFFLVKFKF